MNKSIRFIRRIATAGLCFALLTLSHFGFSQTTTTNYTASETVVFGAGVTTVNVSMWGGGGGGSAGGGIEYSGALNEIFTYYTGAGGGGSNWTGGNVAVVAGTSYNVVVGLGGNAGGFDGSNNPLAGGNGSASSFLSIISPGGFGGAAFPSLLGGSRANAPTPDPGNPYADSGEDAGNTYGGDGGLSNSGTYGASGYDAQGFSGWGYNRGALGYTTGVPGLRPGDGGGGGGFTIEPFTGLLFDKRDGGAGGNGRVEFRYSCNYQLTTAPLASNICGSGSSTVTLGSTSMASGNYVVTYSTTNPTTTGNTAAMTFNGATDNGTFSTISLSASSIITVTNLASGTTCSNAVNANNSVTAVVENTTANDWNQQVDILGSARAGAVSFTIDNKVYVGTGADADSVYADFWVFDAATNVWTQIADFEGGEREGAIGFAVGTEGYVGLGAKGATFYNDLWQYNPLLNDWILRATFPATSRSYATSFTIGTKGFVGTGWNGTTYYNDFYEYNPSTNSWTTKASLGGGISGTKRFQASAFVIGTKGYVTTGFDGFTNYADLWQYDPTLDSWTSKAAFPGAVRRGAVAFSLGAMGYVGTGWNGTTNYANFYEYDPSLNSWSAKADFTGNARNQAVAFSIGSKGYVATGKNGSSYYNDVFEYSQNATRITTSSLSSNTTCTGISISVPFEIGNCSSFHPTGNTFNVELSDATGSFVSPTIIGSVSGSGASTISATIPQNTPAGSGYRIRVVGTNPYTVGTDNGTNFGILPSFDGTVSASASSTNICFEESIDLSATSSSSEQIDSTIIINGDFETAMDEWSFQDFSSYEYTGAFNASPDNLWINPDGSGVESNDASSYYAVNSTGRFGADVTNAVVQSPVFSTIGYNEVSLSFFHTYSWGNFNDQDSIRVQISEDYGSSWITVYLNNSSNVGFLTLFSEQVIDLNAYANKVALMLRFNYAALGALGRWYVDNITIKGVSTSNTYSWTSDPAGTASIEQNIEGLTPEQTTTFTVVTTNNFGCGSATDDVVITVRDTSVSQTYLSICPSELPYAWNGLTFSAAGTQSAPFTNVAGCDSTAILHLTIKAVSSSITNISICPTDLPYNWNGLTFTEGETQIANLLNTVGCDSAATLNLTVKPATSSITNQNICASELPYLWNGITFTSAGTETAHFTNSVGCDSAATLNLNLIPSTNVLASSTLATICPSGTIDLTAVSTAGNSILIINEGFNASGNGWTTFNTSAGGVPENAAWTLQPHLYSPTWAGGFEFMSNDSSQFYISSSVAQGNEVTTFTILESPSFSTEGLASASLSFFHHFKHQPGINSGNENDSIRVQISTDGSTWTNIYFNNSSSVGLNPDDFVEQIISLNGYLNQPSVKLRFAYNGTPFNISGWTGFNLWWAIDNVTVSGVLDADTYTWSSDPAGFTSSTQSPTGLSPTVTTTYTVSTQNGFCSSSDDVTVSVVSASQPSTTNLTICDSELPYSWNGLTFTGADSQTANFTVAGACDSAATLVLSVNFGTSSSTNITICPAGLPYNWNGLTFTGAGTQTANLTNSVSCDSAATLILAVELSNSTSTTNVTICETDLPYSWNAQSLNEAGNLTANFTNSLGCDSVATLNLVVNTLPQNIAASASVADVCPDETVDLSASADNNSVTLLSEDFNSPSDYWSTTNNSTGGVFAAAAWTKRPDGYEILSGAVTYHSNDSSQFYHTSSFAQGAGGTTNTILQSPSFSTVGLSAASLTFYQEYGNRDVNDATSIQLSTDGTSWTNAYVNSSDQGSSSLFAETIVSLNGYLNQPYVMIRFVYTAANDFMWAIDNVSITGTPVAHTYSWSSNPIGFTSSTQNPTGLSLTETTTYAVKITNERGCADSTDVTVVYLPSNTSTNNETVCLSELPYAWNGLTFSAAGTQTATLTNVFGCDSLATLELAVSSPNNSTTTDTICADALPYSWSGMTFNASTSQSLNFTDVNGCDSTATLNLTVNPIPTGVLASASDSSIVSGNSIDLFSTSTVPNGTIINENFNAATNDWIAINDGSGGNVAAANWTLRPDGFASFQTNDNSQFYYSSSDAQGPGLTNTILQSPVFSTQGFSSISLSFYHAFVDNNSQDSVRAQVSTNNGTTWTTVYLHTTGDAGVYNSFLQTTVSLDAFLGYSNVLVRFNYHANYGYYWAIDNVSITGTALGNNYSWVSDPVGYTSAAQNPAGVSPSETTIYSVTATNTFGCTATDDVTVTVEIPCTNQWTGVISTDWNNAGNWCTGSVPSATDDAVIVAATNQPHVTIAAPIGAICDNLTVESGATLTVDAGKALTVDGDLSNEGTILVKADATGIGSLITEETVTGNGAFEMEQYLTGSGGATLNGLFYYVGSPVVGATAASYDIASGNRLWSANESSQSYPQINNGATVLNPMEGYVARVGSTGVSTLTGSAFNTGDQSASGLTRTGTTVTNRGYNLVSNPYPSAVSWDDASKTNLETTMWYRTHQGNTMLFDTYNAVGSVGTNNNLGGAVTGDIPPTQAFWVRVDADGNTGQLDFTNAMRSHGTLASIYKVAAEEGTVRMTLSNGILSDEEIILFNADALDEYDDFDSQKFWAGATVPQIYTTIETDTLVINGMYSTATNPVIDLGIKLPAQGNYSLDATSITVVGESVYLEDRMLGVFQDLNVEPTYAFTSVAGNIPTRFALHFGLLITDMEEVTTSVGIYASNKQINVLLQGLQTGTVQVMDMRGRLVYARSITSERTVVDLNSASGIYVVKVETADQIVTRKVSIQ